MINSVSDVVIDSITIGKETYDVLHAALGISGEAGELLELFLWKSAREANPERVKEELADIFSFAFLLAEKYNLDVKQIILEKIAANNKKYPVEKAKGTAKKYNEL